VCKFRDEYEAFVKAGAVVFGISSDSPEENKAFATAQRLPFELLTDPSSIMRKVGGREGGAVQEVVWGLRGVEGDRDKV
jgi:peroxiredoxin Q/BCP